MPQPEESDLPHMDVVVSGLDEEAYLGRCLDAVLGQDYPRALLSVVYVDGGSRDRTVRLAEERAAADPRLTVLAGLGRLGLPEAMNLGVAQGRGELVAKVDAHGWPEPDFVRRAVEAFARCTPDTALVGGRPEQQGETRWGEAVAAARTSRFGTGGSQYAGREQRGPVETVQCGVYRRAALEAVGGFDAEMVFGEDDELSWRLREHGYGIELDAAIRFHYLTRSTPRGLYRQYRGYGRAKVRVARAHPAFVRPWHLAPTVLVVGGGMLAAAAPLSRTGRRAALGSTTAYGAAAVTAGIAAARRSGGRADLVRTTACFPVMHVGYGLGTLRGLFDMARR